MPYRRVLALAAVAAVVLLIAAEPASADQTTAVSDTFSRTSTTTWGTATTGGTYTYEGASGGFATPTTYGSMSFSASGTERQASLTATTTLDTDATIQFTVSKKPTGGDVKALVVSRQGADGSAYRGYLRVRPSGEIFVGVEKRVAAGSAVIIEEAPISVGVMAVSSFWRLRFWVSGTSPTRLRAKAWKTSAQPASWSIDTTDSESTLQDAGFVGLRGRVESGVTNATSSSPLKIYADNLVGLTGGDTTPPTAPSVAGGGPAWSNVQSLIPRASGSTDSGGSGFAFYQSRTSTDGGTTWTVPIVGTTRTVRDEGETLVQFRSVDWAGNVSAWAPSSGTSGTVRLDRTAPTSMALTGGSADWRNASSVTVTASGASDPLSGLATFPYQRRTSTNGGVSWSSASSGASQAISAEGETLVQFRVVDKANNWSSWQPSAGAPDGRVRIDRTAPAAPSPGSTSHPDPNSAYAADTFIGSWTVPTDTSGIAGYAAVVDDSASTVPATTTQVTTSIEAPNQRAGTHYLHVRALDGAGNWSATAHFAFTVTSSTGTFDLFEPVAGVRTNHLVRLIAHAPSGHTVRFEFRRSDDAAWNVVPNSRLTDGSGTAATLPVTAPASGQTSLLLWDAANTNDNDAGITDENGLANRDDDVPFAVRAVDTVTSATSDPRLVVLDTTTPTLTPTLTPNTSTALVGASVAVSWAPSEPVAAYSTVIDDLADTVPAPSASSPSSATSTTLTLATTGTLYAHVRAVDAAGNWSPSIAVPVEFRASDVAGPVDGTVLDGTSSTLTFEPRIAGTGTAYTCVQYRRPGGDWHELPAADVTKAGTTIGSWPVAIAKGSTQPLVWHDWQLAPEVADNPGGIETRVLTADTTSACDPAIAVAAARRTAFYEPPPPGGGPPTIGGSGDRGLLLYTLQTEASTEESDGALFLSAPDGGDAVRIAPALRAYNRAAAASDDGLSFAYISSANCELTDDLTVTRGAVAPLLVEVPGRVTGVALSPDGSRLAYAYQTADEFDCEKGVGPSQVSWLDLSQEAPTPQFAAAGQSPTFRHSAAYPALCWNLGTVLYCGDLDDLASAPTVVRNDMAPGGRAFFSRDDHKLAYDAGTADEPNLRVATGSDFADLVANASTTDFATRNAGPFSPDGTLIATSRLVTTAQLGDRPVLETIKAATGAVVGVLRSPEWPHDNGHSEWWSDKAQAYAWPDRLENLEASYRPRLNYDSGERWRSIDAAALLQETAEGHGRHRLCMKFTKAHEILDLIPTHDDHKTICPAYVPAGTPAQVSGWVQDFDPATVDVPDGYEFNEDAGAQLALDGEISDNGDNYASLSFGTPCVDLCDNDSHIYAHTTQDDGLIYIQYWVLYRFDDVSGADTPSPIVANHQGDWEGATVAVVPGPVPRVAWVSYSQHRAWYRYSTSDLNAHHAIDGTHPMVNVSKGTHANYPFACDSLCTNFDVFGIRGAEASHDGAVPWIGNALPDAGCDAGCVEDFAGSEILGSQFDLLWGLNENMVHGLDDAPPSPDEQNHGQIYEHPEDGLKDGSW